MCPHSICNSAATPRELWITHKMLHVSQKGDKMVEKSSSTWIYCMWPGILNSPSQMCWSVGTSLEQGNKNKLWTGCADEKGRNCYISCKCPADEDELFRGQVGLGVKL